MAIQMTLDKNRNFQDLLNAFPGDFLHLQEQRQRIAISLYRLLANGKAVTPKQLVHAAGVSDKEVIDMLNESDGVYYNNENNIIGFWGLTIEPTGHKFIVDNKVLYAWCAWDTLFLPGILGKTAEIYSTCPVSKEDIYLKVSQNEIQTVKPESTVISFIEPDPTGIKEDVISNFCHSILFFKSAKESDSWVKKHPGTFSLSLHDAFTLAQMKNQQKYPNLSENI